MMSNHLSDPHSKRPCVEAAAGAMHIGQLQAKVIHDITHGCRYYICIISYILSVSHLLNDFIYNVIILHLQLLWCPMGLNAYAIKHKPVVSVVLKPLVRLYHRAKCCSWSVSNTVHSSVVMACKPWCGTTVMSACCHNPWLEPSILKSCRNMIGTAVDCS